jgi:hypothetical protein
MEPVVLADNVRVVAQLNRYVAERHPARQEGEGEVSTPSDFQHGMRVLYVPHHAGGDEIHVDCERGVVSSVNERYVFVKYDCAACRMVTGDEPYTAAATDPADLRILP